MDSYQKVRAIPLRAVLTHLGFAEYRKRANKEEWMMGCPIHGSEKNKSCFSFSDKVFHCFSCGAKGAGAIDLVMALRKLGFQEAVALLGGVSTSLPPEFSDKTANAPVSLNYEKYYVRSEWLKARGIDQHILDIYQVGEYNNPSRKSRYSGKVMLPIFRLSDGAKVGYLARTITGEDSKYSLPSGFLKQHELWGAWQLKALESRPLPHPLGFVVESPFAVMKLRSLGFLAVSPFGAYLSSEQVEILAQLFERVLYLPDRDKSAAIASATSLLAPRLWLKVPPLPSGVDDPEYLNEQQIHLLAR